MTEIRYPDYRMYSASREEADNAMMALLVGSRLAAHTLRLTEGLHVFCRIFFQRSPTLDGLICVPNPRDNFCLRQTRT